MSVFVEAVRRSNLWIAARESRLLAQYRARRDYYALKAERRGLVYSEEATVLRLRSRLGSQGRTRKQRIAGEVRTVAFVPDIGWHHQMLSDLRELGSLDLFDYRTLGLADNFFLRPGGIAARKLVSQKFLDFVRAVHTEAPVDWVFMYARGGEVLAETVLEIQDDLGIPCVNMCLDDKQSWEGAGLGSQRIGQIDLAGAFDLSWTSSRVACEWYLVEGGTPVYMPEGYDAATYYPLEVREDIAASFVGAAYGFRPRAINALRNKGIPVKTFGNGWGTHSWTRSPNEIFNRSRVNLGFGGIGYSEELTNVKGRDFDVPGSGGGVYITSFNADLAQHFAIGSEIACYRSRDELIELARYYLAHPDEARAMATRAYEKTRTQHRWLHRFQRLCSMLGIFQDPSDTDRLSGNSL